MNSLSWVIYLTDVVQSINFVVGAFAFIILPVIIFLKLFGLFEEVENDYSDYPIKRKFIRDRMPLSLRILTIVWVVFLSFSVVIPNKQTMVLIASSQYGEKILNNPKVTEIVDPSIDLLKTWIEKEKKDLQKEDKK